MKWLIYKLGSWITLVGLACAVMLTNLDSDRFLFIGAAVVGLIFGIMGFRFGWKTWSDDKGAVDVWLMSKVEILDNRFSSGVIWFIRFFFIPFIFAVIFRLFVH